MTPNSELFLFHIPYTSQRFRHWEDHRGFKDRGGESRAVRIHFSVKMHWTLLASQSHSAQRAVRNHAVTILTLKMKRQRAGDAPCLARSHGTTDRNGTRTGSSDAQVRTFLSLCCLPKSYHVHLKNGSKLHTWPGKAHPKSLS